VVLVVEEALANAIEHAYRHVPDNTISLTVAHGRTGVRIRVRDHGDWKEPAADGVRGHGLRMIGAVADEVDLAVTDAHTTLSAHIPHRT
jgi:serine/threonine-protein kinase RsbW